MKIFNTLSGQKEEFLPSGSKVRMFVCGPTVYDLPHIWHSRTYVSYDALARYLRYRGYDVFYLQNITDIDDKIIERAQKKMINPADLAQEYKEAYYEDMKALGINSVSEYAPATQYIPEIVSQVKILLAKDFAYLIEGDGYYFDLTKFPEYGKLSGRTTESGEDAVSRIDESVKKRNKGDFALWKFSPPAGGPEEPGWDTELGYGRPGWHIEDTAITEKHFGPQYDLHGGARDLIFPHHEAEIAQMESISGKKPFVKYWVHSGFLGINDQKMSKSLGNFITIRDALKKYSPQVLRFYFLSSHYRSPLDYKEENLETAKAAIARMAAFKNRIRNYDPVAKEPTAEQTKEVESFYEKILESLDDDFNTPEAFGYFFELIRQVNTCIDNKIDISKFQSPLATFGIFDSVMGVIPPASEKISNEVKKLVQERESAREQKDFARADELRGQIKNLGYEVEDTNSGPLVKKPL
mgnify:CR=1 FL=1